MDERASYIKKRNIFIALLLLIAAIGVTFFVFSAADKPAAPESAEETATVAGDPAWQSDGNWDDENLLAELLGGKLPTGESIAIYYGDELIGVSDGALDPNTLTKALNEALTEGPLPDKTVVWRFEKVSDYPSGFDALLSAATDAVLDEETEACGLYVQDGFVGATTDEVTAQTALDTFLSAAKQKRSLGENSTIELRGVSYRACTVAKRNLMDAGELEALLARCCNEKVEVGGVDYEKIRTYAKEYDLPSETLVVRTVETVKEEVVLSFDTRIRYDDSKPYGYSSVETEGENGVDVYTYEVVYENGKQLTKKLISQHTERSAVDRVIVKGVKQYMLWPLRTPDNMRITSSFGARVHPIYGDIRGHTGIDIAGPESGDIFGDEIYAAMDGVVVKAVVDRGHTGYGSYVIIDHGTKLGTQGTVTTLYAHCEKICVKEGQTVKKGDVIGWVGSTGASTGPHLHFEVRVDDEYTDPLTWRYLLKIGSDPIDPKKYVK